MNRRKTRKPLNESERRRHSRVLSNLGPRDPEKGANFDRWLDDQLRKAYDSVRNEPLPPRLQTLLDRVQEKFEKPDAHDRDNPGSDATGSDATGSDATGSDATGSDATGSTETGHDKSGKPD